MYKFFLKINLLLKYSARFGFANAWRIFFATRGHRGEARLSFSKVRFPIYLRLGTSDTQVFNQVFLDQEYGFRLNGPKPFIIDAGANIGLTSVYFKNKYPEAFIVSVEPESSNFQMLVRNTEPYKDIVCIKGGIWNKETFLKIENTSDEKWAFVCRETTAADGDIQAFSIDSLLRRFDRKEIDILKLDIEGAELEVFSSGYEEWLPRTKTIMIELHDAWRRGTSRSFFKALVQYDFSFHVADKGRTIVCIRND